MELFSAHPEIPWFIIIALMGVASFFFKRELNKVDTSIKELKKADEKLMNDVTNIKLNYLSRFDSVKDHITEKHEELLNKMADIKTLVAQQTTYCHLIQEQKKNERLDQR